MNESQIPFKPGFENYTSIIEALESIGEHKNAKLIRIQSNPTIIASQYSIQISQYEFSYMNGFEAEVTNIYRSSAAG